MTRKSEKPKRPLNIYFRFVKDKGEEIKKQHPDKPHKELQKIYAEEYNKISETQKNKYKIEIEEEKIIYNQKLKAYLEKYGDEIENEKKSKRDAETKSSLRKRVKQLKNKMNNEIEKLNLPEKPKRPVHGQLLFAAEYRKKNADELKGRKLGDVQQEISKAYKELSEKKQQKYVNQYKKNKEQFDKDLAEYKEDNKKKLLEEKKIVKKYKELIQKLEEDDEKNKQQSNDKDSDKEETSSNETDSDNEDHKKKNKKKKSKSRKSKNSGKEKAQKDKKRKPRKKTK